MTQPTNAQLLDAIVDLKTATEHGYTALDRRLEGVERDVTGLRGQVSGMQQQLDRVEADVVELRGRRSRGR